MTQKPRLLACTQLALQFSKRLCHEGRLFHLGIATCGDVDLQQCRGRRRGLTTDVPAGRREVVNQHRRDLGAFAQHLQFAEQIDMEAAGSKA